MRVPAAVLVELHPGGGDAAIDSVRARYGRRVQGPRASGLAPRASTTTSPKLPRHPLARLAKGLRLNREATEGTSEREWRGGVVLLWARPDGVWLNH